MIYMVEMALLDTARRAEWEAWYVGHQHRLLSIPGIERFVGTPGVRVLRPLGLRLRRAG